MLSSRSGPSIAMSGGRFRAEDLLQIERRARVAASLLRERPQRIQQDDPFPRLYGIAVARQSRLDHTRKEMRRYVPVVVGQNPAECGKRRLQPAVIEQTVSQSNQGVEICGTRGK